MLTKYYVEFIDALAGLRELNKSFTVKDRNEMVNRLIGFENIEAGLAREIELNMLTDEERMPTYFEGLKDSIEATQRFLLFVIGFMNHNGEILNSDYVFEQTEQCLETGNYETFANWLNGNFDLQAYSKKDVKQLSLSIYSHLLIMELNCIIPYTNKTSKTQPTKITKRKNHPIPGQWKLHPKQRQKLSNEWSRKMLVSGEVFIQNQPAIWLGSTTQLIYEIKKLLPPNTNPSIEGLEKDYVKVITSNFLQKNGEPFDADNIRKSAYNMKTNIRKWQKKE